LAAKLLDEPHRREIINNFKNQNRLLLIDYDGTLVPFAGKPEDAKPPAELLNLLSRVAAFEEQSLLLWAEEIRIF
jgi:trehalose 6-phosphate synthase/phosphatase